VQQTRKTKPAARLRMTDGKPRCAHRSAVQMLVQLKQRLREISDLNAAGSVLNWDQATYMPQAGAGARGRQLAMAFRINCSTARLSSLAWRQQFEIGLKALEKLKASKSGNALYSRRLRSRRSCLSIAWLAAMNGWCRVWDGYLASRLASGSDGRKQVTEDLEGGCPCAAVRYRLAVLLLGAIVLIARPK
jgi:Carboxypeptidase Taq (M32) metallopeptidase